MKHLLLVLSISLFILSSCKKQNTEVVNSDATGTTEITKLKDHVCTDACNEAGECVFVCGEKGHTCNDSCHPTAKLVDHVCTDACNEANGCVFVHGEKGHTCDESCM